MGGVLRVDRVLREAIETLGRAVQVAHQLRAQETPSSWHDAFVADHVGGLARQVEAALDMAHEAPGVGWNHGLMQADRVLVGTVRRVLEDMPAVVGGVPYWAAFLAPYGLTLTDAELDAALKRIARASSRKHPWLVVADLRVTRLPHRSYTAARRSRARGSS